jgi:anaerobic selenocysteine-containing dehydrogenase
VLELAKKMGLRVPLYSVETVDDWNNFLVKDMGISFEEFKKRGTIFEPIQYRKYEQEGFGTPSGKVELYSSILNKYGYDPLPYYAENPESPISTPHLLKDFPLILMTGWRHVVYFHSSNRQIPWLREIYPEPTVEIHPKTAEEMNIREGDWVWIETPRGNGRIRQRASLTEGIHPKVINASSHWWFPEDQEPEHGYLECNINAVMPSGPPYDPIAGSQALRGLLCRIYKA